MPRGGCDPTGRIIIGVVIRRYMRLSRRMGDGWCLSATRPWRPKISTTANRGLEARPTALLRRSGWTTPRSSASSAPKCESRWKLLAFRSVRRASSGGETEGRGGRGGRGGGGGEGDTWFLRMDRAGGEAFQIPGVGGAPIFSLGAIAGSYLEADAAASSKRSQGGRLRCLSVNSNSASRAAWPTTG